MTLYFQCLFAPMAPQWDWALWRLGVLSSTLDWVRKYLPSSQSCTSVWGLPLGWWLGFQHPYPAPHMLSPFWSQELYFPLSSSFFKVLRPYFSSTSIYFQPESSWICSGTSPKPRVEAAPLFTFWQGLMMSSWTSHLQNGPFLSPSSFHPSHPAPPILLE
jgi:hypothetical protein